MKLKDRVALITGGRATIAMDSLSRLIVPSSYGTAMVHLTL